MSHAGFSPVLETFANLISSHPRMEICCAKVGNGTVNFQPDCYSWCNLDVDQSDVDGFERALDTQLLYLQ